MKVLVCGSRDWSDWQSIYDRLAALARGTTVIHGDARGADRLAAQAAATLGFEVRAFPANWQQNGLRAGYLRNLEMLDQQPDLVIAFQRDGSRGTQHTIDEARKRGIAVEIYRS